MKFLVKFDLEFDLEFEISDGKNLVKFWGRTLLLPAREISERISGQISEPNIENFVSNFATFFGNFVQQKGGASRLAFLPIRGS